MKFFKSLSIGLLLMCVTLTSASAQVPDVFADTVITPQFFISLLAGVLLAIGFQVVLTALSVAIGITAVGNIQTKANEAPDPNRNDHSNDPSDTPMGVKISSGLGLFTMITASVALFFASLLAVKLALIGNVGVGIILGLVIWAAFFTTMAYLEVKSVSSLLGTLISTVLAGVKSSASALQNLFQGSPYGKIENIADHTVEKLRKEIDHAVDFDQVNKTIEDYIDRIDKNTPDYEKIKQDMTNLLTDIRIEERSVTGEDGSLDHETFIKLASEQSNLSKKDVQKLGNVFQEAQKAAGEGNTNEDKAKKVAATLTNASEEDIDGYVSRIEEYLRNTGKEEISPESIREDIEKIVENPSNAQSILTNRANKMDRSTLVALLEQNKNIKHDQAEQVVGYVEKAIDYVANKASDVQSKAQEQKDSAQQTATAQTNGAGDQAKRAAQPSPQSQQKIKTYLDGLGRPELQYDSLKRDLEKIMHDPKHSPEVIKNRLSKFDRQTLTALLTSNDRISRRDIENIVRRVDESKNTLLSKAEEFEAETRIQAEKAKQAALHQAENARKTAASAAWWLFGTAVVSGFAAALGGWLAIL